MIVSNATALEDELVLLGTQQVAAETVANDTQQLLEQAEEATGEVRYHTLYIQSCISFPWLWMPLKLPACNLPNLYNYVMYIFCMYIMYTCNSVLVMFIYNTYM